MKIEPGTVVSLEYSLHFGDGEVVEATGPGEPVAFLTGRGQIMPGLERALAGREAGEALALVLPPGDAFGEHDPEGLQEVPRSAFPAGFVPEAGMELTAHDDDGDEVPYTIREVRPEAVVIDLNHPLAGKAIHVEAKVIAVRKATDEELEHGHAHEPGSRHHV